MGETAGALWQKVGRLYRKPRRALKNYLLRRRRAKSVKRRVVSRKATYALVVVLLLLFGAFGWALTYLSPDSQGRELSIDALSALAAEKRIASATFLDEDNRLIGAYVREPIVEPKNERSKQQDRDGADEQRAQADRDGENDRERPAGDEGASGSDRSDGRNSGNDKATDQGNDKGNDKGTDKGTDKRKGEREASNAPPGSGNYFVVYPSSDAAFGTLLEMVTDAGAKVAVDPQNPKQVVRVTATYLLPLLILAGFFGLLFTAGRGGSTGIGEVLTFGSIGKKRYRKGLAAPTTFADVGGEETAVQELKEVVDYLKDPERYEELGALPPKGVLLVGPPGCGKTLLAKAVAGEAGVPFFSVAGAEFVESLVGVGAARVRDLFTRVRAVAPAILFIDELDAAGRKRGYGDSGGGSDEREQTLNQILVEMDGFEVSAGIVVIGATNRPDILDPALLRPGRFDRHVAVEAPDLRGRKEILMLHARGKPVAESVDYDYLATRTAGFSGADLANVMNEGALLSIRLGKIAIETPELEEAIQRVLHGPQRRGSIMAPSERERVAVHEAGHAVVAAAVDQTQNLHRVTILQRARGLGTFGIQRESDQLLFTEEEVFARLVIAMGGIAGERLLLGKTSTGGEQDLEQATEIARDIVGRYGMSPRLGRTRLLAPDIDRFLGVDGGFSHLSESTHKVFDEEVRRLIEAAEKEALRLLQANATTFKHLVTLLQTEETLEGAALYEVLVDVTRDTARLTVALSGNGAVAARGRRSAPTAGTESDSGS